MNATKKSGVGVEAEEESEGDEEEGGDGDEEENENLSTVVGERRGRRRVKEILIFVSEPTHSGRAR